MRPVSRARSEAPGSRSTGHPPATVAMRSSCGTPNRSSRCNEPPRQPRAEPPLQQVRGVKKVGAGQLSQSRRHGASGSCSRFSLGRKIRGSCRSSGDTPPAAFEPARWSKRACNCGRLHETGAMQIGRAPRSTSSLQSASRRWPHRRPRRRSRPRPRLRCPPFCRLARLKAELSRQVKAKRGRALNSP